MNSDFFSHIDIALASERLDAYRKDNPGPAVTLARYLLNMAVCESLYSPLQIAEIALRNAIHAQLGAKFVREDWYDDPGIRLTPFQREQVAESRQKLADVGKPITPGRMVAELSFGFWTGFFNNAHARTGLGFHLARHAFPHAPAPERSLVKMDARWRAVRDLRNRVFHHERILHWMDLKTRHAALLDLIGWMSPKLQDMAQMLDRFIAVRSQGLVPWLIRIRRHWPVSPPSTLPVTTANVASIPAPFSVDNAETPFGGQRWGGEIIKITPEHLEDLRNGRALALDIQNEHVVFLSAATEGGIK